jgi:hypothetical protein
LFVCLFVFVFARRPLRNVCIWSCPFIPSLF